MNFIDYENEFDAMCEAEYQLAMGGDDGGDFPIYGMDKETYIAIRDSELYDNIEGRFGVKPQFYERFPIMEAVKNSKYEMCSICLRHYKKGDKVFCLPCKHNFHIDCIMPWFKSNHKCPNCRFDLNEGQNEDEERQDDGDIE